MMRQVRPQIIVIFLHFVNGVVLIGLSLPIIGDWIRLWTEKGLIFLNIPV